MAAAQGLVLNVNPSRGPVQADRAAVPGRRAQRLVAVVLRGPFGGIADVLDVDLPGRGVTQPHERAALSSRALGLPLDGVVSDRGTEVGAPVRLAVITVGARIGEDIDAAV